MPKKVLILGAGYAGIEAALTLQRKKKPSDDLEITLVDKNSYHTLLTELHEVAGNRVSEDAIIVPLHDIFQYTDIKLIRDEIKSFNFDGKSIIGSVEYKYDYLILAAGSEPNFYGIQGLKENSFTLWSYQDALRVRDHIRASYIKASQEPDPQKRKALLTFVIGGAGFTGVELCGELAHWSVQLCEQYNTPQEDVRIILVEALPNILPILKDYNQKLTLDYLTKKLKVEVLTSSAITNVDEGHVTLKSGTVINTNTLIWTAGVKASCITDQIDMEKVKACRIKVDEYAMTQHDGVYAIGDIAAFLDNGHTLPALVEAALQTGNGAAKNILAEVRGKEKKALKPELHGVMVSVGSFFAVSEIMGLKLPIFLSIVMKYLVNIHYLFGIGGLELIFKYLKDEILHKKHKKFLLEQHYTMPTRAFWLVPIRLFLGYSWFMEGFRKIQEGWLTTAMLAGKAAAQAADAGTSASVSETGEKVFRIVSAHTPGWYEWIANTLVIPNALLFQIMIVAAEIGIGLALAGGAFTFIAGLAALGLTVNFLLSTGLYETSWWYIPAAITMLGGAGRAFGLDYYIMPYLMRQWRYFSRNRKLKFFLWK